MWHSNEVRKLVLADYDNGLTYAQIYAKYGITGATVSGWRKRLRETGSFSRLGFSPGAPPAIATADFLEYMKCPLNQQKTQVEIGRDWGQSKMTISNMMRKIGFTRKKKTSHTPREIL